MKNTLLLSLAALLLSGCAVQRPLMDFTYVSTQLNQLPATAPEKLGDVKSEWICQGKDGLGLMETAVNDALSNANGGPTYIKNASFSKKGNCVMVSGEAYK